MLIGGDMKQMMPIKNVEETVDFLNSLLEIDRNAITILCSTRIGCNEELANHPTVQVHANKAKFYSVGFLGIINGLFGVIKEGEKKGAGFIVAEMDIDEQRNPTKISRFIYQEG